MRRSFALAIPLLLLATGALAQHGGEEDSSPQHQHGGSSHNDRYVDPDLDVQRMVDRFENDNREVYALRHEIVAAMGIEPGDFVADVGAGTGAFLDELVAAVGPAGHVFSVEISPRFVEHLRERANAAGYANVSTLLSSFTSATLPAHTVDRILLCDTYHHFDDHEAMLASMHRALKPGGELIVVDFDRVEGKSREWILSHIRASQDAFRAEIEAADFEFVESVSLEGMVDNFYHRYRRP